jgi:endonuclease YncB( thermonuclease family)
MAGCWRMSTEGGQRLNAELVRQGYAQVVTVPAHVRHQELLLRLLREAREAKRGS